MLSRRLGRWIYLALTATLLLSLLMTSGCSSYKSFTQLEGDVRFSFEYPESYRSSYVEVYPYYIGVLFSRLAEERQRTSAEDERPPQDDSWLSVQVYSGNSITFATDAKSLMENEISNLEKYNKSFQIEESSSVVVSGVEAVYLKYSFLMLLPTTVAENNEEDHFEDSENGGIPFVKRAIYFDHGGFIWEISLRSEEQAAKADTVSFNHILKTFKILN